MIRINSFPKYTLDIRKLISKKRKLYKKYVRLNRASILNDIRILQTEIKMKIEIFESNEFNRLIDSSPDISSLYRLIKNDLKDIENKTFFGENGEIITDKSDILENFSKYFSSVFTEKSNYCINETESNVQTFLEFPVISQTDILRELNKINVKKAFGPSPVNHIVMKKCSCAFSKLFYNFFNMIIDKEKIPDAMKISYVKPLLKSGKDKHYFCSYRGVSVQNNFLKLFDKLMLNNFIPHIYRENIIPVSQYSYTKGISIENQIIDIVDLVVNAFNDLGTICVDLVFLDKKNAFDCIKHDLLIEKLQKYGVRGKYLNLKIAMMRDRKQFVVFENAISNCVNVDSGVAQGGSSSPVEFNTFKADMGKLVKSFLFEFADDTVLINVIKSENDCLVLQDDLNIVNEWCILNGLKLNAMKSKLLRVSLKRNEIINFTYTINDILIEKVNSHRHLGVFLDENLNFNIQCDKTVSKALQKWALLKYMCKRANADIF
jgi:hypothetical protein